MRPCLHYTNEAGFPLGYTKPGQIFCNLDTNDVCLIEASFGIKSKLASGPRTSLGSLLVIPGQGRFFAIWIQMTYVLSKLASGLGGI